MSKLTESVREDLRWTKTWNGADALATTSSFCLDFFGSAGALRGSNKTDIVLMFKRAWNEDPLTALKLLFYTRDIREGYGEKDTFKIILKELANEFPEIIIKNMWAVMEFGCAKDLYCLIGTKCENAMWVYMRYQFEKDYEAMQEGKAVSLLAKWIATPDANSNKTAELGKLTRNKFGYTAAQNREYVKKLRELRAYINIPERLMASNKWSEIDYSKLPSQTMRKFRKAFLEHDADRFNAYLDSLNKGETKMNTATLNPVEIVDDLFGSNCGWRLSLRAGIDWKSTQAMWDNLKDNMEGNALVLMDESSSMYSGCGSVRPISAAYALATYISERNKGDWKDLFIRYSSNPHWVNLAPYKTLKDKLTYMTQNCDCSSTNLEKAFDLVLAKAIKCHASAEDMPKAIIVVSDMQVNMLRGTSCDMNGNAKMTFTDVMRRKYANNGYELPQVIYWNVNAQSPVFHATKQDGGISLVSGFSSNILKQIFASIGSTPYDLMMDVVNSKRYANITL